MTDTTDTKALQRPTRKHYDWSKAVWMDCDRCGEAHTRTVLADDGARICAGCCDSEYYSAWEDLAETAIKLLEAERQRADKNGKMLERIAGQRDKAFADIEKAEAWVDALETRLQYIEAELVATNDLRIAAQEEIAALKGEQVPKYWAAVSGYSTEFKHRREDAEHYLNNVNGMFIEELFTAPQKPVVFPPLRTRDDYESRLGNGDIGPYNHGHLEGWNAAIEAAGGIVSTSDERLMQDMSGIVKDGE